ncbi:MAG: FAD-dependent oxidoreductase [Actinobacteria bacterium]|nr:FAD-dependent oxidoreductase [Actinomycetota bacterium]
MTNRIRNHPVLAVPTRETISFTWHGRLLTGFAGDTVTSALVAAGIDCFGRHSKDGSPESLFCANGQCSACLVMADDVPVKGCMTPLKQGMNLSPVNDLPSLPRDDSPPQFAELPVRDVGVLIIGGGPAGMAAAIELGSTGVETLLVDDKNMLGGKLVLQTHKFFGSEEDSRAGMRGYQIAKIMEAEVAALPSVDVCLDTTAVAVYSDGVVGLVTGGGLPGHSRYHQVRPRRLLVATGARERMLAFPGNTLPGVFGAGAFQTLVNRDLVLCSRRLLVVGAGNVGLIAAYHALQAGVEVAAVVEFAPNVGGYAVHADKLRRLDVPILTRHTILKAVGNGHVEQATIGAVDEEGAVIPGSEQEWAVDTVLIAVGLNRVDEFYHKAQEAGIPVYSAGDAAEIAEASAAMIDGRLAGQTIAAALQHGSAPSSSSDWISKLAVLRSKPGPTHAQSPPAQKALVEPVFHCLEEIPCNPCTSVCPEGAVATEGDLITGVPYLFKPESCKACLNCVRVCPGLAITLVDSRTDYHHPTVTVPYELPHTELTIDTEVIVVDRQGEELGVYPIIKLLKPSRAYPATALVQFRLPRDIAWRAAGFRPMTSPAAAIAAAVAAAAQTIICRCERVTETEIRDAIRAGVRDLNQLKALTRTGMGSCGGKTCRPLLEDILRQEGVPPTDFTPLTERPLFVEVSLGALAGEKKVRS